MHASKSFELLMSSVYREMEFTVKGSYLNIIYLTITIKQSALYMPCIVYTALLHCFWPLYTVGIVDVDVHV